MTSVNKYRLWCIEENTFTYAWNTEEPTICPNYHTDRSIDTSKTAIIETITQESLKVEEPSEGFFQSTSVKIIVPGTTGTTCNHDLIWPMNVLLWRTELNTRLDMVGDDISVLASPEKIIGILTSQGNIGDVIINVTDTVTNNVIRGFELVLDDGINKCNLGMITTIDKDNDTVTVTNPLTFQFTPGTLVKLNLYIVKDYHIDNPTNKVSFGDKGFKGKLLPANTLVRFKYTNNNGQAKDVYWRVEYYNQG